MPELFSLKRAENSKSNTSLPCDNYLLLKSIGLEQQKAVAAEGRARRACSLYYKRT